ncbi:Uma2 family endonuclease [Spongiactinospora rosea]|uniref:Uma2 family endonuclease n=1 Tax=Spongiactinospora rosea TaxID=2248750 RepID=A0A366LSG7_9ACTN|nr:Uma2 family endonuclease [Spongiactinospora rosea]RBQ16560.1 Uma2 family endonuclease [Spongiactinospora rosea]
MATTATPSRKRTATRGDHGSREGGDEMPERFTVDRAVEPVALADEPHIEPASQPPRLATARDVYRWLPRIPGWSVAAIDGRITMSSAGGVPHARGMTSLGIAWGALCRERGLDLFTGSIDVCLFPRRDVYVPDLVIAPRECKRWGDDLHSEGILLVGEIVSPGTIHTDRSEKPDAAARAGVPFMLLVDPLAEPARVTLYSDPDGSIYRKSDSVSLGEMIHIPSPVDLDLDTSIFIDAEYA